MRFKNVLYEQLNVSLLILPTIKSTPLTQNTWKPALRFASIKKLFVFLVLLHLEQSKTCKNILLILYSNALTE